MDNRSIQSIPEGIFVDQFTFDALSQTISIVVREKNHAVLASNPPQLAPDRVWKEVYAVKDGRLQFIERIEGRHIPRKHMVEPEQIIFGE